MTALPPPEPHPLAKRVFVMPANLTAEHMLLALAACEKRGIEGTFIDMDWDEDFAPLLTHIDQGRVRRVIAKMDDVGLNAYHRPPTDPEAFRKSRENGGNPHSGRVMFACCENMDGSWWFKALCELDCCLSENTGELCDDISAPDFAALWARLTDDQKFCVYDVLYQVQEFQKRFEDDDDDV